jgi:hypothetical protein
MSYQSRQRKRVLKRHRRSEDTRSRHFLIEAQKNGRCFDCGGRFKAGATVVYRHTPLELLHRGCAERRGIKFRPSVRWERAQGKTRPKPKRKRTIVRTTPRELLAQLVIEAGRTPKGGYTRSMLERWGVAWPPPSGWPRTLVARWTADEPSRRREVLDGAELDEELDRALEAAA